jgi:hypothetical protein
MITALIAVSVLWIGTVVIGVRAMNQSFQKTLAHLYEQQKVAAEREQLVHAERMALLEERDALLERIQRPEYRPIPPRTQLAEDPEPIEDEFNLVGVVQEINPEPDEAA